MSVKSNFALDKWLPVSENGYVRFGSDGQVHHALEETPKAFMADVHDMQTDGTNGWSAKKKLRHAARVPKAVMRAWEIQDGVNLMNMHPLDRDRYMRRKLQDPDWSKLKICSGRL